MYLLAYFLLADVCYFFPPPQRNMLTCLGFVPEFKHNYYLDTNLPEYLFSFSFLENTHLGLVQAGTSLVGLVMYWYIQRYWKIEPKEMARLLGCFF